MSCHDAPPTQFEAWQRSLTAEPWGTGATPRLYGLLRRGANQSHVGGLTVSLAVIFERPKKKVHTHAKGSAQFCGRISMYSKVR
jgi:hypothetical protein